MDAHFKMCHFVFKAIDQVVFIQYINACCISSVLHSPYVQNFDSVISRNMYAVTHCKHTRIENVLIISTNTLLIFVCIFSIITSIPCSPNSFLAIELVSVGHSFSDFVIHALKVEENEIFLSIPHSQQCFLKGFRIFVRLMYLKYCNTIRKRYYLINVIYNYENI